MARQPYRQTTHRKDPVKQYKGAVSKAQGKHFEEYIDLALRYYEQKGEAAIEKTPEPMRPTRDLGNGKFIAYYEKHAQADYKGTLKGGRTVLFDAKYTANTRIDQSRVTLEQAEQLDKYQRMGADTLLFNVDDYDEEQGIFSGYGAVVGNIDDGGDIIEPGAFTKTIAEGWERVKILALHNDCWLPIGRPIELREDAKGLFIKAKVSDTSTGRDVKVLLKDGVLNELSIGYDPVVFDYDESGIRHLREVKLWEVSIVTWAMNPEATITGYKAAEAADRAAKIVSDAASDVKEGRKISSARLKTLKDASETMKKAAKTLDALITEVEGEKAASRKPQTKPAASRAQKSQTPTIEITF